MLKNRKLPINNYSNILIKIAIDTESLEIIKIVLSLSVAQSQSNSLSNDNSIHNNIVNDNTNNNTLKENLLILNSEERERLEWIADQSEEQLKRKKKRKEALEKIEKIRESVR